MTGIKRLPDITLFGAFDDARSLWLASTSRLTFMRLCLHSRRAFGIDWYPESCEFKAFITAGERVRGDDGLSEATATMRPDGVVTLVPAEWWRRAGYRVLTVLAWPLTLVKGGK